MLCCLATEQIVEPEFDLQSGVTLFNAVFIRPEQVVRFWLCINIRNHNTWYKTRLIMGKYHRNR